MKKFIMMMALAAMSSSAMAQSSDQQSTSVYFQYNPSTMVNKRSGGDDQSFTGLTVGFDKYIGIADATPIYLKAGAALNYNFFSKDGMWFDDDDDDEDNKLSWYMASIRVPVSFAYNWEVSPAVAIEPYAGLTARLNLFGKLKVENDYDDDDANIFDKKDMGSKEMTFKRFQLGWQIGVNVKFNDTWFLGASYGTDFSEIIKKVKVSQPALTVGLLF